MEISRDSLAVSIIGTIKEVDPTAVVISQDDTIPGVKKHLSVESKNREAFTAFIERQSKPDAAAYLDGLRPLPPKFTTRPWSLEVAIYGREFARKGSELQVSIYGLRGEKVLLDMAEGGSTEKLEAIIHEICNPALPNPR